MAKVTINGFTVEVADGTMILPAAEKAGVQIPRFCYHPDLPLAGNCRICQVEIEGMPKLVISCMTPVKDGMVVRTDTDRVKKAVQGDLEFLLANHPVDCPICDQAGECYLQDFYMSVGLHGSRVPLPEKVKKRKVLDLGSIVLDSERCVMCSRCIRFSDEVSKTHQFGFFQRGSRMEIGTFRDRKVEDAYSGCYDDVCPVGALTLPDFRFKARVWFLKETASICPECSTGCNIRIDHGSASPSGRPTGEGQVYRYTPRRNPDVNRSWMCDQGRYSYKQLASPGRLGRALLRGDNGVLEAVPLATALDHLVSKLGAARGAAKVVAGLATPRASLEALYLFRRLLRDTLATPHLDFRVDPATTRVAEREDQVLRRADHNPNTRGAELLDLKPGAGGKDVAGILAAAAAGKVDVLWVLGPELWRWPDHDAVARAVKGAAFTVLHDTHEREEHALFDLVLPTAAVAECEGSFVNFAMRLQRFRRAVAPPGEARSLAEVLAAVEAGLRGESPLRTAREIFHQLSAEVEVLRGLTLESLPNLGVDLAAKEVATAS